MTGDEILGAAVRENRRILLPRLKALLRNTQCCRQVGVIRYYPSMLRKYSICWIFAMALLAGVPHAHGQALGNGQTLEEVAGKQIRGIIVQSISVTVSFTAPQGISAGQFTDGQDTDETTFTVTKFPLMYFFKSYEDKPFQPFIGGYAGWMESDSLVVIGPDVPDRMKFNAWSVGGNAGVKIRLADDTFLSPAFHMIYGRTRNEFEYRSADALLVRDLFDGVVVNWEIGTLTLAPALRFETSTTAGESKIGFDSEAISLNSQTLDVESDLQKVRASCTSFRNRIWTEMPLPSSVQKMPLSIVGDFSRTDVRGDVEDTTFYEIGGQLNADSSSRWKLFSKLYAGAGYVFNETLSGWSLRLGADF